MKYPYGFPPEYQDAVEVALAKAELKFRKATENLGRHQPGFGRPHGTQWDEQAFLAIESVFLDFASQCLLGGVERDAPVGEINWKVDEFIPLIIDHVYFNLMPKDERSSDWNGFQKTAEERVRSHEGFETHLETERFS